MNVALDAVLDAPTTDTLVIDTPVSAEVVEAPTKIHIHHDFTVSTVSKVDDWLTVDIPTSSTLEIVSKQVKKYLSYTQVEPQYLNWVLMARDLKTILNYTHS